jgi:predicted PurR-regulated permease PerM
MSTEAQAIPMRNQAASIVATGTILAILYFARDVLVPITLAVLLSLLLSFPVRGLRRLGLGATSSVLTTVVLLVVCVGSLAAVLGVHVARMAASLPQYEATIREKIDTLSQVTLQRFNDITGDASRLLEEGGGDTGRPAETLHLASARAPGTPTPGGLLPVEVHRPPASAMQMFERVLSTIWVPLETTLIVLVVLIFVLLEHEMLRDRFIRIVGGQDLRATTLAFNEAADRLSWLFVSQFSVNAGVGTALTLGLLGIGVPNALLLGVLAGVLRFVPYVGVWIAALFASLLAAAVDPGWALLLETLALFVLVETLASQLVEPQLYGHTTGLSPLSVVVAAIFWSWLWGPVGLILSTPLTLCLVVAGRHVKALSVLDLLLGDTQALTLPQHFYQRALSGDPTELIADARVYLKRKSFATYCDVVLMPAMHLALIDLERGAIDELQRIKVRGTIVAVIEAIAGEKRPFWRSVDVSVLDRTSAGRALRQERERRAGRWQGPLQVPPGSVMLCVSLGSFADDLAAELLVRILREQKIDARHIVHEEVTQLPPPNASPDAVALVFLVSAYPDEQRRSVEALAGQLRTRIPRAQLVTVLLPGLPAEEAVPSKGLRGAYRDAHSLSEAAQVCLDWIEEHAKPDG